MRERERKRETEGRKINLRMCYGADNYRGPCASELSAQDVEDGSIDPRLLCSCPLLVKDCLSSVNFLELSGVLRNQSGCQQWPAHLRGKCKRSAAQLG